MNSIKWIESRLNRPLGSALFFFSILLIGNVDRLMDPPYWDALTGVYSQGYWLMQNGFDYFGLYDQPDYIFGGPRSHIFMIHAPLFGVLSLIFSPEIVFLWLHLLNLLSAAVVATLFFWILKQRLSWKLALLWVLAAAANPAWSGQCASIYVEMPLAATMAVSFYCVWKHKYKTAALFCFLGYFFKNAALLNGLAFFVFALGGMLVPSLRSMDQKLDKKTLSLMMLPLVLMVGLNQVDRYIDPIRWNVWSGIQQFLGNSLYEYWDLLILVVISSGLLVLTAMQWRKKGTKIVEEKDFLFLVLLSITVFGFWASYIINSFPLVRYTVMITFPLFALAAFLMIPYKRARWILPAVFLGLGLLNQNGALFKSLPVGEAASGHRLERSREYLKDLDGTLKMSRYLEERYFAEVIVAKFPYALKLRIPEFGYVSKALPRVVAAGRYPLISGATRYRELERSASEKILTIHHPDIFEYWRKPDLRPRRKEDVLVSDEDVYGLSVLHRMGHRQVKESR
jgi:hypothetical protein